MKTKTWFGIKLDCVSKGSWDVHYGKYDIWACSINRYNTIFEIRLCENGMCEAIIFINYCRISSGDCSNEKLARARVKNIIHKVGLLNMFLNNV